MRAHQLNSPSPTALLVSRRIDHDFAAWATALRTLGFDIRSADPAETPFTTSEASGAAQSPSPDVVIIHDAFSFDPDVAAQLVRDLEQLHPRDDSARDAPSRSRVVFRHRDLPWQRHDRAAIDLDALRDVAGALHVTATLRARRELEARDFSAVTWLPDAFDLDSTNGAREATRHRFGFDDDSIVLLAPTRGEARRNVAGAIRYANELSTFIRNRPLHLWVRGPIADDHRSTFDKLVARSRVPVVVGAAASSADAYAACDVVVFTPTWDCFGDAILEAIAHRRPCVSGDFPTLGELTTGGVRVLPINDAGALVKFLAQPESTRDRTLEASVRRARVSYDLKDFPNRVGELLELVP